MKCYVQKNDIQSVKSYVKYLEEVFGTSFRYFPSEDNKLYYFFESKQLPSILLIRGENSFVLRLLHKLTLIDKTIIIIISCNVKTIVKRIHQEKPYSMTKNKLICVPKYSEDGDYLTKYDGKEYDLMFNPCMAELKMLRDSLKEKGICNIKKHFDAFKVKDVISL